MEVSEDIASLHGHAAAAEPFPGAGAIAALERMDREARLRLLHAEGRERRELGEVARVEQRSRLRREVAVLRAADAGKQHRPQPDAHQRTTSVGTLECLRTSYVSLPCTSAESPLRPWLAMKMRSQPCFC